MPTDRRKRAWRILFARTRLGTAAWLSGTAMVLLAVLSFEAGVGRSTNSSAAVDSPFTRIVLPTFPRLAGLLTGTAPIASPIAPSFELLDPADSEFDPFELEAAAEAVQRAVDAQELPGAALVVGKGDRPVMARGFGRLRPGGLRVDPDQTLYDLASLTKVLATTAAVMLLVEDGKMGLDQPVQLHLPEFAGADKANVTVRQLLTHTAGMPAGLPALPGSADSLLSQILGTPLISPPGERVVYSDLGAVVLFAAARQAAGEPLENLLSRRIYNPLGMASTSFNPAACERCAPTADTIHGTVHDPIASGLGGVAGNAGLFSTATDVARFAAMLASGGELDGVRIFEEQTIRQFTSRQVGAGSRALGWDTPDPSGSPGAGNLISSSAYGHTGFTGTSLWIDPDRSTWAVLLSNRTLGPASVADMQALRREINDRVATAADPRSAD